MTTDGVDADIRPPGTLRAGWLVSMLAFRRKINRLSSALSRKRRSPAIRHATSPKKRGGGILLVVLSLFVLVQATTTSITVVKRVAVDAERRASAASGIARVSESTMRSIDFATEGGEDEDVSPSTHADLRAQLDRAFEDEARLHEGIREEARVRQRADELAALFETRGASAFRASSEGMWYGGADALAPLALVGLLFAASITLLGIAGPDQELARVESSFEWWFTFPVHARGLLLARVLETALANPLAWFVLCPFFSVVFWSAGYSWLGIAIGIGCAAYVGILAGSLRVVAETVLRRYLSLGAVARVQALLLLVAYPLFLVPLAATSPDRLETVVDVAGKLPRWLLINPANPIGIAARGREGIVAALTCTMFALGIVFSCTAIGAHMVRDGLVKTTGIEGGRRQRLGPIRVGASMGVLRKEFTMLLRDRNLFVQTIALPATMLVLQLFFNRTLLATVAAHPLHSAAAAFAVGAFVLATGACNTLALDLPILWMYLTVPRSLERILVEKAIFWAGVSAAFTLGTFIVLTWAHPAMATGLPFLGLALIGVVLNAFIATGIGVLGTDPLETEPRRRVRVSMVYLYMLLAGMFAYALYAPSLWAKFAQVVLSTLLAFALWQKVRDHAPYFLDPAEAPAPSIAVADGVIAALAFFVLQGLLAILFWGLDFSPGAGLLSAFAGAGLVVAACTLFIFWRSHLPNLASQLGLRPSSIASFRSASWGIVAGLAASLVARAYLVAIDHIDVLRRLRDETIALSDAERSPDMVRWFALLAIVAAPLFEEFIFRAVLYGGFRRSIGPARAAVASALVFAIVHPAIAAFPVFVLGLAAAWSFERSRFLLAPILAHMTYNAVIVGGALR